MSNPYDWELSGNPDTAKLREKVDWAYLINWGTLTLFSVMKDKEVYPREVVENIVEFLEELVPSAYRNNDPEYQKRIKDNTKEIAIDIRQSIGGFMMSKEIYEAQGVPHTRYENYIKPSERFGAIIDLLNRLNVLTKLDRVEIFGGEKWIDYLERVKKEEEEKNK